MAVKNVTQEELEQAIAEEHAKCKPPAGLVELVNTAFSRTLKARLSLLEQEFLMEMAKVGDFGTIKYAEEDWRDNDHVKVKARIDSLLRHVGKFASAEFDDLDDETKLSHLAHAAFNCMMIYWIAKHRPERDDRYKGNQETKP